MDLFTVPFLILYAIALGVAMKIADLLDEHGLRWFPGDKLFFGLLWGLAGILLILSTPVIANILLARILVYVPRQRLDYFNHALAAVMIFIAFTWKSIFLPKIFFPFFAIFLVFGFLRDYYGNGKQKKTGTLFFINEFGFYHIIVALIYSILMKDYTVFMIFTAMQLSYNAVKYGFYYAGWSKEI